MKRSLYAGRVLYGEPPHRNIQSKWYISPKEFEPDTYPPFVAAGFILFSSISLPRFYNQSKLHKYFKLDDVHLAIIAEHLNIEPIHMDSVIHRSEPDLDLKNIDATISAHSYTPAKLAKIWKISKDLIRIDKTYFKHLLEIYSN